MYTYLFTATDLTDWDRFARTEYARLAMEEDSRGDGDFSDEDSDGGWDDG